MGGYHYAYLQSILLFLNKISLLKLCLKANSGNFLYRIEQSMIKNKQQLTKIDQWLIKIVLNAFQ